MIQYKKLVKTLPLKLIVVACFVIFFSSACEDESVAPDAQYSYQIPQLRDDGWNVSP